MFLLFIVDNKLFIFIAMITTTLRSKFNLCTIVAKHFVLLPTKEDDIYINFVC